MPVVLVTRSIAVERFVATLSRYPSIKRRLFTPAECLYCERFKKGPEERFAARFAAKCAIKSVFSGLKWGDVAVLNDPLGAPFLEAPGLNLPVKSVSLSHDKNWAIAAVLMEAPTHWSQS